MEVPANLHAGLDPNAPVQPCCRGLHFAVMEASSQALDQLRLWELKFERVSSRTSRRTIWTVRHIWKTSLPPERLSRCTPW